MIRFDLHIHSTASDGAWEPAEVARAAHRAGLEGFSLTDHDTLSGLPAAADEAARLGLRFIPGVEISATVLGREVHLLAYGVDPDHEGLAGFLETQRRHRQQRGEAFLDIFRQQGVLPPGATLPEVDALTRPHLAALLVEHGAATDFRDAFERFLVPGTATWVDKPLPDGAAVLDVVHAAGGVVSLAHPGHAMLHRVIITLIGDGLDALEAVHPAHDDLLETYYRGVARQNRLMVTGGTDFHRPPRDGRAGFAIGDLGLESVPF